MTIYGHIWWKLIYQYPFWPVLGFMVVFRAKNKPKINNLALQIPKIQSGAFILCRHIPNDYLWSYMMETDIPVCIVTCFGIYGGFQGQKLVKINQNITDFAPRNPKNSIWCLNIVLRHPQWQSIVIYMMESDIPVCVLTCLGVYGGLQGQKLVKMYPKWSQNLIRVRKI